MRIGLDLDGVVANWSATAMRWLNDHKGYNLKIEEPPYWDWLQENIKPEDWKWLWNKAIDKGMFEDMDVMDGAPRFVRQLCQIGDVTVITSRPHGTIRDTLVWWWNNDFPTINGWNFVANGDEKFNIMTDVLIEDNLEYAKSYELSDYMPSVLLLDRPYNQTKERLSRRIYRVHGYTEALNYAAKLKERLSL